MKKLSRLILIGIGALVGAIVILLLAVNLYVQSQATQARIQQELSQRLNAPLRIRGISVTPWGGLKLNGITIPQTQPGVVGDFLEAQTFRLRIRFGSLFAQRLVIKEVSLIGPNVTWIQNADGKWRLPESPRPAEVQAEVHEKPAATAPAAERDSNYCSISGRKGREIAPATFALGARTICSRSPAGQTRAW